MGKNLYDGIEVTLVYDWIRKKTQKNGIVILGLVTSTFVINTYICWAVFPVFAVGMGKIDTVIRY